MRRSRARVVIAYGFFAAVAAAVNLGSQWCVLTLAQSERISRGLALWPALVIGTGTGLIVKYILDKRFIFEDRSTGLKAHGRMFSLYSVMGLATTTIFWGTEFLFSRIGSSGGAIYIGGAIGLAIGYVVKYELDRRFVFTLRNSPAGSQ